jgi:uncharacterized protein
MKADLKTAMRSKDVSRLAVLRAVFAATLNASKTSSPVKTDTQVLALLRKKAGAAQDAVDEFKAAGRNDLVEKEQAELDILNEYTKQSGMEVIDQEGLKGIVQVVLGEVAAEGEKAKENMGAIMKRLLSAGGPLDGKDFSKSDLARIVKEQSAQ